MVVKRKVKPTIIKNPALVRSELAAKLNLSSIIARKSPDGYTYLNDDMRALLAEAAKILWVDAQRETDKLREARSNDSAAKG